ncbi:DJ-1/PfpI family protein [Candidatus Micrarchaeota archaeon]|nr:DJ-1/PfpI family protein [Candidatus Micrarchaeota archaeon]
MKKVLIVIAHKEFQDYEFVGTVKELKNADIEFDVVSTQAGTCTGSGGTEVEAKGLESLEFNDYQAVAYIGGPGTIDVRADERFVELAKEFMDNGKVVAAICWAPTILAKAGVLKGKKATVWLGEDPEYETSTSEVLKNYGAEFVNESVVENGKIITANGPQAASEFGKKIAEKMGN